MNVNDQKYSALRAQGYTGHVSDMLLAWLHANGATSSSITDAWKEMLSAQGYTGHVNDSWRAMLSSLAPPEIGRQINDLERWFWCQNSGEISAALFSAVLQASLIPSKAKGDDTPTFTRASAATFTDFEGVVRTVNSGEPRFSGARRVENLQSYSEDFSNAAWIKLVTCTVDDAETINFPAANDGIFQHGAASGTNVVHRIELKADEAGTIDLRDSASAGEITCSLTTEWQTFTTNNIGGTGRGIYLRREGAGQLSKIYARKAQTEETVGRSDQTTPSEYVSTDVLSAPYHGAGIDGVMYFDTFNDSSVTDNVVTEATGPAIGGETDILEQNNIRTVDIPAFDFSTGGEIKLDAIYSDGTFLDGSSPVLTGVAGVITAGVNVSNITVNGEVYAGETIADGTHLTIGCDISAGTVTTVGPIASGAIANVELETV